MKVKEFIRKFDEEKNKEEFIKKHVIRTYVPFSAKVSLCKNNVALTMYNNGLYELNTPIQYMLWVRTVIESYTDIEFSSDSEVDFDLIERYGIVELMMPLINTDYEKFLKILKMVANDTIDKETNLVSYFDRKIEVLEKALGVMEKSIIEMGEKIERNN